MLEILELLLHLIVEYAILLLELIGVVIIIFTALRSVYFYVKKMPDTKVFLAKGLALGLEFKLGSEILKTVVLSDWAEMGIVAGIIGLRAALTFLIHWDIKEEEKREKRGE